MEKIIITFTIIFTLGAFGYLLAPSIDAQINPTIETYTITVTDVDGMGQTVFGSTMTVEYEDGTTDIWTQGYMSWNVGSKYTVTRKNGKNVSYEEVK